MLHATLNRRRRRLIEVALQLADSELVVDADPVDGLVGRRRFRRQAVQIPSQLIGLDLSLFGLTTSVHASLHYGSACKPGAD